MSITPGDRIFKVNDPDSFSDLALEIFNYQAENNQVYNSYLKVLGRKSRQISNIREIPFLPAGFFRSHRIVSGSRSEEVIFRSSGTTASSASHHYVTDIELYKKSFGTSFRLFYGNPADYTILALLPSYLEREDSSLVFMVNHLIKESGDALGGFYIDNYSELLDNINLGKDKGKRLFIIGVSFALLDLAELYAPDLSGMIVMETGGMKGRRKEITREELHTILKEKFNVSAIHSEYGMTELLSQAYSPGDGFFSCPPWMKILLRDPQDPLTILTGHGKTGGINIIDLANINSCSFIATDDIGRINEDGTFEVLGRLDNSDIRGCNLLI